MTFTSSLSESQAAFLLQPRSLGHLSKNTVVTFSFLYPNDNKGALEQTPPPSRSPGHHAFPRLSGRQPLCYQSIFIHPRLGWAHLPHMAKEAALLCAHHHHRRPFVLPTSDTDHTDATARFAFPMESKNPLCLFRTLSPTSSTGHTTQESAMTPNLPPPSSTHSYTARCTPLCTLLFYYLLFSLSACIPLIYSVRLGAGG